MGTKKGIIYQFSTTCITQVLDTSMNELIIMPAAEQSKTQIEGVFNQESRSLIGKGIYCVQLCTQNKTKIKNKKLGQGIFMLTMQHKDRKLQFSKNLIKQPNFTISSGLGYAMTIIMEKNSLRLGIFTACTTKLLDFIYSRIKLDLVFCLSNIVSQNQYSI